MSFIILKKKTALKCFSFKSPCILPVKNFNKKLYEKYEIRINYKFMKM